MQIKRMFAFIVKQIHFFMTGNNGMRGLIMKCPCNFKIFILGSWTIFVALQAVTYLFEPYRYFPAYGFIGYIITIGLALVSLNFAHRRWHYIAHSLTLILFGALASLDIIWSKQEILYALAHKGWHFITAAQADGYIQILIIIMNIFTGSLAASSLFYGLNKDSFNHNHPS